MIWYSIDFSHRDESIGIDFNTIGVKGKFFVELMMDGIRQIKEVGYDSNPILLPELGAGNHFMVRECVQSIPKVQLPL